MNIDRRLEGGRAQLARALAAMAFLIASLGILAQPAPSPTPDDAAVSAEESSLENEIDAGESANPERRWRMLGWNHYEGPWFSIRVGAGILYEAAAYVQDEESEQQFDLEPDHKLRDGRLLLKGSFPRLKRKTTWTSGIMYNGPTDSWLMRETGIMVEVPELSGHLFIGRTKEGFSLNKVMTGYSGWTMERATINDATIPILADGIKWLGYVPERRILWNIGAYGDWLSEGQSFSTYDNQYVARVAWLPIAEESTRTLLHVGMSARYGTADEGELQLRSRPEAFPAEYFVDTGKFAADDSSMLQLEAYYRPGPLLIGTEYFFQKVDAPASGDPFFHGGDVVVSWNVTGEVRRYNTRGGFFSSVSPAKSVFDGGWGGWELVGRLSYIDLDSGPLHGGKFWRFTPMVNWHLSDHMRLEFAYGYGVLDRFDLTGATQFFQTRIQLQF